MGHCNAAPVALLLLLKVAPAHACGTVLTDLTQHWQHLLWYSEQEE
jgi:hypothetical protein